MLENLLTECALKGYLIGQLNQTANGLWQAMLWDGSIGYSSYAAPAASADPSDAIRSAIDMLDHGAGRTLECNAPAPAPEYVKSNLRDIIDRLKPAQPQIKWRKI